MKRVFVSFLILFSLIVTALAWTHGTSGVVTYTRPTSTTISNSPDSYINGVLQGVLWDKTTAVPTSTFTYSDPATAAAWGTASNGDTCARTFPNDSFYVALDTAHQTSIDRIFAELQFIIPITFVRLTESTSGGGTHALLRQMYSSSGAATSMGDYPGPLCPTAIAAGAGGARFSAFYGGSSTGPGNFFDWGARHEIGHTLGLKHPFDTGGSGVVAAAADCWTGITTLAYTSTQPGSCVLQTSLSDISPNEPQTYMLDDVAALQYLYGMAADVSTTIEFDETTGAFKRNGVTQYTPASPIIYMNIVANNANNTLKLLNWNTNPVIDLTPCSRTNVIDSSKLSSVSLFNFTISCSAHINNYIGASGNDDIHGNSSNNTIDGGAGTNTFRTIGASGTFVVSGPDGNGYCQFTSVADGTDLLKNIQIIIFSNTTKNLDGLTCNLS